MEGKHHYRSVVDSPYLSSQDIVEPTILTISHVRQEPDKTKKTKDVFNTAFFREKELRPGEELKPMVLNATNSRTMKSLTGSPYVEDWNDIPVMIYVDHSVRFGRDTVEGLRISTERPNIRRQELTPSHPRWAVAVARYRKTGGFEEILRKMDISDENKELIKAEAEKVEG